MEQMIFDKEAAVRRFLAINKRIEAINKDKIKKPSVLKKLSEYKET